MPAGATTGPVDVVTGGQASNGVTLTVTAGPHLASLSTTWGPAGTTVTLTGTGFGTKQSGDQVKFTSNSIPFTVGTEEVLHYPSDGIGSVRMVTGHLGSVVARHDYQPFGVEVSPPPSEARIRFAGKEHDDETGGSGWQALDYFGARYLHSASGRFTTVDPVFTWNENLIDPQRLERHRTRGAARTRDVRVSRGAPRAARPGRERTGPPRRLSPVAQLTSKRASVGRGTNSDGA